MDYNFKNDLLAALRAFAEKPENIDNFESYLEYHFEKWREIYATTPESLTSELLNFANMEL